MADANARGFPARPARADRGEGKDVSQPGIASDVEPSGTRRFGRGQLYHVLSNPIYVGRVRHRDKTFEGEHDAIIDSDTFDAAQELLAEQAPRRQFGTNTTDLHLLNGLLFDEHGNRLTTVHTRRGNIRYRYYASKPPEDGKPGPRHSGWRLPARTVEEIVEAELMRLLDDGRRLGEVLQPLVPDHDMPAILSGAAALKAAYPSASPQRRRVILGNLLKRIDLAEAALRIHLDLASLVEQVMGRASSKAELNESDMTHCIECRFTLRRRGIETKLVLADPSVRNRSPDKNLVRLLVKAHDYLHQLTSCTGQTIAGVAAANNVDRSDFTRVLRLAFLAPDLVDCILSGTQPVEITAQKLSRLTDLPLSWFEQRALLCE